MILKLYVPLCLCVSVVAVAVFLAYLHGLRVDP